ncbi:tagaturonate reductase [Lachnotalea glycerini]|uniref:Tagaturonate reductase n=1 Tax=Lachnotalea glycerini TaxID=1763509 RepID=A0A318EM82_9FIRM|nr:tagaturonate reductase [Lachnotalea glycerini]PXV85616.1 tagaturonate reductase [Lachnotalea glycerini]
MDTLNYKVLEKTGYEGYIKKSAPEKVLQFGEGNFLRAFVDYYLDCANEKVNWNGKVALVQPISLGLTDLINEQEGLYTLYLRGSEKGKKIDRKRVISAVSRCINAYTDFQKVIEAACTDELEIIVSNTTEAGIVYDPECEFNQCPPSSFPAKLTRILYERYKKNKPGIIILSCELIDNNGKELLKCVNQYIDQWNLEEKFKNWIQTENIFCSTLVDRIVPGRIKEVKEIEMLEEINGYHDELIDVSECFGVWIIEGPKELEDRLPFKKSGLNVHVVEDVAPYKKRKVRILNGAHTGFVLGAYLSGQDIVRDCMHNNVIKSFMNQMLYEEIIPTLSLDKNDLKEFAEAVEDRFNNPFVNHELMSISLNSTSKWKARNMPSFLAYYKKEGKLPKCLTMSLAAYIAFYSNDIQRREEDGLICKRPKGNEYKVQDDAWVLDFYYDHRNDTKDQLVYEVLSNKHMWDTDLTEISGLEKQVVEDLTRIHTIGAELAYASCL